MCVHAIQTHIICPAMIFATRADTFVTRTYIHYVRTYLYITGTGTGTGTGTDTDTDTDAWMHLETFQERVPQ